MVVEQVFNLVFPRLGNCNLRHALAISLLWISCCLRVIVLFINRCIMMRIEVENNSVFQGASIGISVSSDFCSQYDHIQVEIFDCGTMNPASKFSIGMAPKLDMHGRAIVMIDTSSLSSGFFEVKLIRFHDGMRPGGKPQLDFIGGKDYERVFLQICNIFESPLPQNEIYKLVLDKEAEIERKFLEPIDIRGASVRDDEVYAIFMFVKNILIGTRIRMESMELVPTNSGLTRHDENSFVNEFLKNNTSTNVRFEVTKEIDSQERASNPVCLVHFPAILAASKEEAFEYCRNVVETLLLALALSRESAGEIFECVIYSHDTGRSDKLILSNGYKGNLLTGVLAGESPEILGGYLKGLTNDSMGRFLADLYKAAWREVDPRYMYIRLWQILELMADQRGFDSKDVLVDYDGNVIFDEEGRVRYSVGAVNTVYRLLKEASWGQSEQTWRFVNVWFSFRSAIAHYGALTEYQRLSRPVVREWAKIGLSEIEENGGHDNFLFHLRYATNMLLARRLLQAT